MIALVAQATSEATTWPDVVCFAIFGIIILGVLFFSS